MGGSTLGCTAISKIDAALRNFRFYRSGTVGNPDLGFRPERDRHVPSDAARVPPLPIASRGLPDGAATVLGGSALIAVAAHAAVPFWPAPPTFQTLAVLVLGAIAGPRLGTAAVPASLAEGVAGLPVFAAGAGPAVLAGPTGRYPIGSVAAVALVGFAGSRGWLGSMPRAVATFRAAHALVFGFGRLAALFGAEKALALFLLGEGLKIALAATLVTAGRGSLQR